MELLSQDSPYADQDVFLRSVCPAHHKSIVASTLTIAGSSQVSNLLEYFPITLYPRGMR
jgi:hypothetical protein